MKNLEVWEGRHEALKSREDKMKEFKERYRERTIREATETIKKIQAERQNSFGDAEMANRDLADELFGHRSESEKEQLGTIETSLDKESTRVKRFFSREPLKKIMERIKAIGNPREKKKEIEASAKQHATMTKLEEMNRHLMEKVPAKRFRYESLSLHDQEAVDKAYKKLRDKLSPEHHKYERNSDYNKLITDIDTARNFDIKWFNDLAKHYGIEIDLLQKF